MDDGDANDFTFCKVDSQAVNYRGESPKAIPDVNKITLKDKFSDGKDLKKLDDSSQDRSLSANLPRKYVASTAFSLCSSNDMLQPDSKSISSLEAAGSNGESPPELGDQKPVLNKPSVRAKVPFEKGYSQMDWLKLTRTHPDLADGSIVILTRLLILLLCCCKPGLKGRTNRRLITMDEVKKHKTEGSMWTVLKGRVYNITSYMKFHPGGVDMLKMAAGKDCTSLFNKYHAWVNAEFLLEKCLVGVLDYDP